MIKVLRAFPSDLLEYVRRQLKNTSVIGPSFRSEICLNFIFRMPREWQPQGVWQLPGDVSSGPRIPRNRVASKSRAWHLKTGRSPEDG